MNTKSPATGGAGESGPARCDRGLRAKEGTFIDIGGSSRAIQTRWMVHTNEKAGAEACPMGDWDGLEAVCPAARKLDVFGVEHRSDGVEGGGDADAGYHGFGVYALLEDDGVVRLQTDFAALDGG